MSSAVKQLLKKGADDSIKGIVDLAKNAVSEKVKLEAQIYLVDRQYGKPVQPVGNDDTGKLVVQWKE